MSEAGEKDPSEGELDRLIEEKRPDSEDEIRIAFLGTPESGKSVLAALLKYRLVTSWIPMTDGKMRAAVVSGHEKVNETIGLLKEGRFPPTTSPDEFPRLEMDLLDLRGRESVLRLIMHDMSGEVYKYLLTKNISQKKRLKGLLTKGGKHIVFATKYVILVDCALKDKWNTDIAFVSTLIGTLGYITNRIQGNKHSKKMTTKIAIVFTKEDRLRSDDKELPTADLAKECADLYNSLERYCEENTYRFFKIYVSSREESDEECKERVKNDRKIQNKKIRKRYDALNAQNQESINMEADNAFTVALQNGDVEEEARAVSDNVRKELQDRFDKKFWSTNKPDIVTDKIWRVNVPLKYSHQEYDRLISWLLNAEGVLD